MRLPVTPVRTVGCRVIGGRPSLALCFLGIAVIAPVQIQAQDRGSQFVHASNLQNTPFGIGTASRSARPQFARISVLVFDYVDVPARAREAAEAEAAYVMSRAGLESEWIDCGSPSSESSHDGSCRPLFDSMTLCVRIVSDSRATLPGDVLGFASLPPAEQGVYATIFYSRIAAAAVEFGVDAYQIMGCAMVHEVGHLLLDSQSHTARGLMRAQWSHDDFQKAAQRSLRFSRRDSALLQAQVEARSARLRASAALGVW
jgi:hypothetical protein